MLGFAPFGGFLLPPLLFAALLLLFRQAPPRVAAWDGFAYGLGLFGAGTSWLFIALNAFGSMPAVLAALGVAGLCVYLALFPAMAGWLSARLAPPGTFARLIVAASSFALLEWLRSWLFSGFPWLSLGYAEVESALGGYAPIGGVFLTGLAVTLSAACLATLAAAAIDRRWRRAIAAAAALAAIWIAGASLRAIEWSEPAAEPLAVSLVQGNIAQDLKFEPQYRERTLDIYRDLVAQARGRLIVLPESALPMFADEVPEAYVAQLRDAALRKRGDLIMGLFFFESGGKEPDDDRYYNSVVSLGSSPTQVYRKYHLVPFGETIPLKPLVGWFIRGVLNIPLADQTPGPQYPAPFEVAGEKIAVNICYEDAFGAELIRQLPEATMLVNVTNDAWYGRSLAARQHDQIAAMRALESSRPMLRATNTGITSVIDHRGHELASLPWFSAGVLEATIAGRKGSTPYVRTGDVSAVVVSLAWLVAAVAWSWKRRAAA